MKKYLKIGLAVVALAVVGYFVFLYLTPKGQSEMFMADLKKGLIEPTSFGFIDSHLRESHRYLRHIIAERGEMPNIELMNEIAPLYFQFPKDVVRYTLIESNSGIDSLYDIEDVSEAYYNHPEQKYLHGPYKTYQDFRQKTLKYKWESYKCEMLDSNFVRYKEPISRKVFTYKITTFSGIEKLTLVWLKESDGYKVGAMFRSDL